MKFFLAILSIAGSALTAEACPVVLQQQSCGVAVQSAPSCAAVQSFSVAPVAVAVPQFHIQHFAAVQTVVPVQQVALCGHGCGARAFGLGARVKVFGGRSVVRQRTVIRNR